MEKVKETKITIEHNLKIGVYIKKNNYHLFSNKLPVLLIKKIRFGKTLGVVVINDNNFNINKIKVISDIEANKLLEEFNSLKISDANDDIPETKMCIREATGIHKIKYKTERETLNNLWRMKKDFPLKTFEAYKCKYCDFFHIGKPLIVNKYTIPITEVESNTENKILDFSYFTTNEKFNHIILAEELKKRKDKIELTWFIICAFAITLAYSLYQIFQFNM